MKKLLQALPAVLLVSAVQAQDLRHLEPLSPEPVAPPAAPAPITPEAAPGQALPALQGIVFLSHPGQIDEPARLGQARLDTTRVPFLADEDFARYIARWRDGPLSERTLQGLMAAINLYYAAKDRPFVSVSVPNQDITDGILRVLVVEGRLSALRVTGNRWFDAQSYLGAFDLETGDPIDRREIEAGLDWIGRSNPFRAATVVAAPGEGFGGTALEVVARERKPLRWYTGINNQGSSTTDYERLVFGTNWGRAFGRDHQLNAQLSASPDFHKSVGLSAHYTAPLPQWRHLLHISGAWSRINADVPAFFDSEGEAWQLLAAYEIPLAPRGNLRHSVRLGVDLKRSDNNLEFGGFPVTDNVTQVAQFSLAWQAGLPDAFGHTSLGATLVVSPGDLGGHNDDEAFDASRWRATADYRYGRLDLQRQTALPYGLEWRAALAWQQSNRNLLGSEQLGLSGTGAVRGYRENDLYADEGWLWRNELVLPALSPLNDVALPDQLRFHLFYDYGRGNSVERLPGEAGHQSIDSVGVGARYRLGEHVSASAEYGWQQSVLPGQERDNRAHLSLVVSF